MSNLTAVVHWQWAALCNSFILRSTLPMVKNFQLPVRHIILSICFTATMVVGKSQERSYGIGGHQFIGEVGVVQDDAYTPYSNASITAFNELGKWGVAARNHYRLRGLEEYSLCGQLQTLNGKLSMVIQQFGTAPYSELSERLSFSKKIYDNFSIGLGIEHMSIKSLGQGESTVYPLLSTALQIDEHILFGFQAKNPFNQQWANPDVIQSRSYFASGLSYKDEYNYQLSAQLTIENDYQPSFGIGGQIPVYEKFGINLGLRTAPVKYSSGLWFNSESLKAGIGTSFSPFLGLSPGAWIAYQ